MNNNIRPKTPEIAPPSPPPITQGYQPLDTAPFSNQDPITPASSLTPDFHEPLLPSATRSYHQVLKNYYHSTKFNGIDIILAAMNTLQFAGIEEALNYIVASYQQQSKGGLSPEKTEKITLSTTEILLIACIFTISLAWRYGIKEKVIPHYEKQLLNALDTSILSPPGHENFFLWHHSYNTYLRLFEGTKESILMCFSLCYLNFFKKNPSLNILTSLTFGVYKAIHLHSDLLKKTSLIQSILNGAFENLSVYPLHIEGNDELIVIYKSDEKPAIDNGRYQSPIPSQKNNNCIPTLEVQFNRNYYHSIFCPNHLLSAIINATSIITITCAAIQFIDPTNKYKITKNLFHHHQAIEKVGFGILCAIHIIATHCLIKMIHCHQHTNNNEKELNSVQFQYVAAWFCRSVFTLIQSMASKTLLTLKAITASTLIDILRPSSQALVLSVIIMNWALEALSLNGLPEKAQQVRQGEPTIFQDNHYHWLLFNPKQYRSVQYIKYDDHHTTSEAERSLIDESTP